ncbi:MAG: septum formation protein Maf [Rhodobacterales bacterium]|nr:MAG: septum formation protein Maf [Rhodobacterales bacterium]
MAHSLILASRSEIRATLLANAGLVAEQMPALVDEDTIKAAMLSDGAKPRDIADALAEHKARRISAKHPEALVLGCDQVADLMGRLLSKPANEAEARQQLRDLSGRTHKLLSAAVICHAGRPVWRHIGVVCLAMRKLSDRYVDDYVKRNWARIRHTVGAYRLEEEGVRLFSRIEGDYFSVLGLPLTELLTYLIDRGEIAI